MGLLYDTVQRIDQVIASRGLDKFRTRGQIALKTGFAISLVKSDTPDDPLKQRKLVEAAAAVLGQAI